MKIITLSIGLLPFVVSCDKPDCKNENQIFEQYSYDAKEYVDEILNVIESKKDLDYWFDQYIQEGEKEYVLLDVTGKQVCARVKLLVLNHERIENVIEKKDWGTVALNGSEQRLATLWSQTKRG